MSAMLFIVALSTVVASADFAVRPPQAELCRHFGVNFYAQADKDFTPFINLSTWEAQQTWNLCRQQGSACFVVQVLDGQLFVAQEQAGFQSRNRLTMALIQRMAAKLGPLPDAEFVVDTTDGYSEINAPLFVIAKFPNSQGGILYPDFSSYAWPESECPSEPFGAHVWHHAATMLREAPPWHKKSDSLFWRGAPTSVYRQQLVPRIATIPTANVSFIEWVLSMEGRQIVRSGTCVPAKEWCRHKFLANLPGNTMTLSLKYRLLCGSVVITSPFWYHEWFYSQLQAGVHYIEVDAAWTTATEALAALRTNLHGAEAIATASKNWAEHHLTDDAFDCYWRHLVELAHQYFPRPQISDEAVPLEYAMFNPRDQKREAVSAETNRQNIYTTAIAQTTVYGKNTDEISTPAFRSKLDVVIVIPARAADLALMDHARQTWLRIGSSLLSYRHYFIFSAKDTGITQAIGNVSDTNGDILVVDCPHGYTWLLLKMTLAYRTLLTTFDVAFFMRADVDSVLPLDIILPLLLPAARGEAVTRFDFSFGPACVGQIRWQKTAVGALVCQTQCAVDRNCHLFSVDNTGSCATFSRCNEMAAKGNGNLGQALYENQPGHTLYEYRLRSFLHRSLVLNFTTTIEASRSTSPFILGTILYNNKVLVNDTYNPQWNNPRYHEDLGLGVYPPYPEASGYVISSAIAAFIANIGTNDLTSLAWKSWAIEDAAFGTALAGLNVSFLQLPVEVREHIRVVRVPRSHTPSI